MKAKTAGIVLLVASGFWAINDLYFTFLRITEDHFSYWDDHKIQRVLLELNIIIPIAFIILSIYLIGNKADNESSKIHHTRTEGLIQNNLTIGDWLLSYLIAAIPLVGLIFMILWTTDKENQIRRVWAQASLIWAGIITLISLVFVAAAISSR